MKIVVLILSLMSCVAAIQAQSNSSGGNVSTSVVHYTIDPKDSTEIFAVLDSFIINFKQPLEKYLPNHLKTYLFPHVRISSGKISIIPNADSIPVSYWQARMPADWDHSEWVSRTIVQASPVKVHLVNVFRRFRKDNSVIADETSLYIMEKVNGKWGVRGRSSFAK
jgi:hypothetical protein